MSMLRPAPTITNHIALQGEGGAWPSELDGVLSPAMAEAAKAEITQWPDYAPTPLHSLSRLAAALDLGAVHYKDEAARLGLGSFKALGGAYAVLRVASDRLGGVPLAAVRRGEHAQSLADLTVTTATDGNHGRSVAWGARMAGCRCRIYIHAGVSQGRQAAMEALGAEVVRIDGDYDEAVRRCAADADAHGWIVVSDTSYEGYTDIPRHVMAGYSVMASEILEQIGAELPTHLFVQAGVGGLAAAMCARVWQVLGDRRPQLVIVEPDRAACLFETAKAGRPTAVPLTEETVMAGLSCGEVSLLAWEVLRRAGGHFITIGEEFVGPAMRLLAKGEAGAAPIVAGESAVPGLIALVGCANDAELRERMELGADSRVLLLGCEGATDPEIYRAMVEGG